MRRFRITSLVTTLLVASTTLLAPPASAESDLGGYSASAEAAVVRVGIFEPAVPIPSEPQVDASIGFARASTTTGPSARGLASYLWPGDAVGDGLGVLLGNEALDYPVKTSSTYPATEAGPASSAFQINSGNGMAASADGQITRATVVGLGVGNGIGDPGSGLCRLVKNCTNEPPKVDLPDPIAAAATVEHLKSQSTVVLGEQAITATARSTASGVSLLAGLVTIDSVDMRSESRSDGVKGAASGTTNITGLRVLGRPIDVGALPKLPQALKPLGITIEYLEQNRSQEGADGSLGARGLTITVDVAPLRNLLRLGGLSALAAPAFTDVDQLGPVLLGLLKLGTKVVITVGDVRTRASAAPAYLFPTGPSDPAVEAPLDGSGPLPGVDLVPDVGSGPLPGTSVPPLVTVVPASVDLPGLGTVPSWFVLAGLALVALLAWGIRGFGTWIFAGGSCVLGSSVGVPDLRKARSP